MRYFMQYLKTENVNLVKDMGMIPYKLHELYGYDSTVVTFKNGEYDYLNTEVKGLKMEFVKKIFHSYTLDGALYLLKNSKRIDMLQIFHVTLSSFVYVFTYKKTNPNGKIYLKLDSSFKLPERLDRLSKIGHKFLKSMLDKVNLITIEEERLYDPILKRIPYIKDKFKIIPNGVDFKAIGKMGLHYDYDAKENIILHAARIGAEEKNTPMLLEAFKNIKDIEKSDWKLVLAGPIEEEFKDYIDKYFAENPLMKNKVEMLGNIKSRKELYSLYCRAKIFALTSDFESFAIALIEAAAFGDIIISTDVGIASELVDENNGALVNCGDTEALTRTFENYMNKDLKEMSEKTHNKCRQKFDWDSIIKHLNEYMVDLK
ncbi:glycosyltransferase family 4 protein [Inconstantimicrobium porci]|uniref:glycosyltransferase family 4 protein n=1 Tax=Inconstantimicrobium porci TaxID=2652291 RepID=UPI0024098C01|nr:glycosyltransferase family 4 protein [Inconstantimicrobium porci]MDD6771928.1 glycosyltransferase family 4 protein [Inconstantimicrobium porci]